MRRSISLISIAFTAFSAVIMASVIYGYRVSARSRSSPSGAPEPQLSAESVAAAPVPSLRISPQEAAEVAAQFLDRTDAYSVQLVEYNGMQAFKVTFSSADVVYISLEGQVLGSEPAPVQLADSGDRRRRRDDRGGGGGGGEGEDAEHESEHDD